MNRLFVFESDIRAWEHQESGYAYAAQGNHRFAIEHYYEALKYVPDDALTHWDLGFSLLCLGNYVQGFEEAEWRWKLWGWKLSHLTEGVERIESVPPWRDQSLACKHLLIFHEQGYGDALMMARYIPQLKVMTGRITLLTVQPLARLMAEQFDITVITELPEDLSSFDLRCAAFDPMRRLNQTVLTVPRQPYIYCDLDPLPKTIGIVWSGQSQKKYRSASEFIGNLKCDGYRFYALQPGPVCEGVEPLAAKDFADTLEVVRRMQHIVSVDTAGVHLAAATGHPSVHLMLPEIPEWRWHHAYCWYPNLKLHRDWESLNKDLQNDPSRPLSIASPA